MPPKRKASRGEKLREAVHKTTLIDEIVESPQLMPKKSKRKNNTDENFNSPKSVEKLTSSSHVEVSMDTQSEGEMVIHRDDNASIIENFIALDITLDTLKRKGIISTFDRLREGVEKITQGKFYEQDLEQLLTFCPDIVFTEWKMVSNNPEIFPKKWQLCVFANSSWPNPMKSTGGRISIEARLSAFRDKVENTVVERVNCAIEHRPLIYVPPDPVKVVLASSNPHRRSFLRSSTL